MKLKLDKPVTVEFDSETLADAGVILKDLMARKTDSVLDALFVLLSFRAIEAAYPGTVVDLLKQVDAETTNSTKGEPS